MPPSTSGCGTVTHLFNAMRPFLHRDPGIVGAALARDDVVVQLILDGVHLASETVRVVSRAAPGTDRARHGLDHRRGRERRRLLLRQPRRPGARGDGAGTRRRARR